MKEALIDTDILSYYLRGDEEVVEKVLNYLNEYPTLNISYISYYEVVKGLEYKTARKQVTHFEEFANRCKLINIDLASVKISAEVYGNLRRKGITIGTSDILIAGIAVHHNLELITNNTKHYKDINKLAVSNWKT